VDFYGKSKFAGEIKSKFTINIRTSIIGHELSTNLSLLNWFLKQKKIKGFKKAFFSGLTTLELSKIIVNEIILKNQISYGLFHISGPKICKLNLLKIIKKIYKRKTIIKIDNNFKIDRSLNSSKFRKITKLKTKNWPIMIKELRTFNENF
jgi:dTDP-4-dehydrorhamnose reductase